MLLVCSANTSPIIYRCRHRPGEIQKETRRSRVLCLLQKWEDGGGGDRIAGEICLSNITWDGIIFFWILVSSSMECLILPQFCATSAISARYEVSEATSSGILGHFACMLPGCLYTSLICTQLLGISFWPGCTQVPIHSSKYHSGHS